MCDWNPHYNPHYKFDRNFEFPKKLDKATQKFLNDMIDVINGGKLYQYKSMEPIESMELIESIQPTQRKRGRPKGSCNKLHENYNNNPNDIPTNNNSTNNSTNNPTKKRGRPKGSKNKIKNHT